MHPTASSAQRVDFPIHRPSALPAVSIPLRPSAVVRLNPRVLSARAASLSRLLFCWQAVPRREHRPEHFSWPRARWDQPPAGLLRRAALLLLSGSSTVQAAIGAEASSPSE